MSSTSSTSTNIPQEWDESCIPFKPDSQMASSNPESNSYQSSAKVLIINNYEYINNYIFGGRGGSGGHGGQLGGSGGAGEGPIIHQQFASSAVVQTYQIARTSSSLNAAMPESRASKQEKNAIKIKISRIQADNVPVHSWRRAGSFFVRAEANHDLINTAITIETFGGASWEDELHLCVLAAFELER
ncbi:hypothetical protein MSAN_00757500 [Mycena sanguinolenta]|uniref:Uncharacterized protein n=1 Tax=Mycena sanguinolenta TaxID=230812 RepID=A0A8H6Z591_9AGAR|nr:hypothetical protein MSAN_00757500 [Mycena sanguinolenta]